MNTNPDRKKRTTINIEIVKLERIYLEKGKLPGEISKLLDISYTSALGLCNKIGKGCTNDEIIKKKADHKVKIWLRKA